jgi:hypothetical protein
LKEPSPVRESKWRKCSKWRKFRNSPPVEIRIPACLPGTAKRTDRPALGPVFLRPSRRSARPTSGPSAAPVPIPTLRPERPSGMHRDADRRHRHAQLGTSLTWVLSGRS